MLKKIITHSEKETIEFGKKLAKELRGGEVICLYGNLGAGKTTLIKGIALGLGVKKIVTSPTFILMNLYGISNQKSVIRNLVHIDYYRIKNSQDIIDIGAQEYFNDPNSVVVIEWPERIRSLLPKNRMEIKIKIEGEKERRVEISNF